MPALTAARDTKRMLSAHDQTRSYKVAASVKIFEGSLVMLDAGHAKPAATATSKTAIGRAKTTVDNSSGSAGDKTVEVEEGVFKWTNSGSDAVDQDDVGADCFMVDDQTVAETNGGATRSRAGIVVQVDSDGVWVQTGLGL